MVHYSFAFRFTSPKMLKMPLIGNTLGGFPEDFAEEFPKVETDL